LSYGLLKKKVNYILDADIRGFFDNLDKGWMIKFIEHRVADPRILRLIQKWLKAGVMEEGKWSEPQTGTAQGSVISPLLANVYLHYSFDLWVNVWRQKWAKGEVVVIRYADDSIAGFQYQTDADRFLENLRERLAQFGLELHPDKTRRIEFGRFAEENRRRRGEGKPETFDFLGLTHISGKNSLGRFAVRRKTIRKRIRAKLGRIKPEPPGCRWQSGSSPRETRRWPKLSLDLRPGASAAGAPVAFVEPELLLLGRALGSASAVVRTKRVAHLVFDGCRVVEARPSVRSAQLHSTGHGLVAGHD
jgi:hypothetical protein